MDETTKAIIDGITIRFQHPTRIPTGQVCSVYYDCFQLTPNDLARLAAQAIGHLEKDAFDIVVGIAYSGILFAAFVARSEPVCILQEDGKLFGPDVKDKRVVIADDVVYRGRRLGDAAEKVEQEGGRVVAYACIVDRSEGKVGTADRPLWSAFQTGME